MNKKISLGAAIAFALIVAAAVFSVTMVYSADQYNKTMSSLHEREVMYGKLAEIVRNVSQKFYGTATINQEEVEHHLASGYLEGINDPYAVYYSPAEYEKLLREQSAGSESVGIGVALEVHPEGYLQITEVYPDSPAQLVGLEEGSLIIKIDDTDITAENNEKQMAAIVGPEGSKLILTVRKDGEERTEELTRREVAVPTVYAEYLPGGIGYLRLTAFDQNTSNQFNAEFKKLEGKGAKAFILDLRDNTSPTLESATRILDRIVPSGPMANLVDRDGTVKAVEMSDTSEMNYPFATLVNKNTAGAAEMFALTLRDYQKSPVIGTTTAGIGVSQEVIMLSDGSAIKITVALYQSPLGEVFHEVGVKPDYDVALPVGVTDWTAIEQRKDPQRLKGIELLSAILRKDGLFNEEEIAEALLEQQAQQEESPKEQAEQPDTDTSLASSAESSTAETSDGLEAESSDPASESDPAEGSSSNEVELP